MILLAILQIRERQANKLVFFVTEYSHWNVGILKPNTKIGVFNKDIT